MFRFKTIVLETSYVENYEQLANEIDRLVAEALESNGNCQLVNVQVNQVGEKNASSGIYTIFLYTVEVLGDTASPEKPVESV